MKFEAYVINMSTAQDRWLGMERRLRAAALPYQRIEAVIGREIHLPTPEFDEASSETDRFCPKSAVT